MSDYEYSNGACGSCQQCGEPTDEEWHAFCSGCYAEQQGWERPDRGELAAQHEERESESITQLAARLGELEVRIRRLERERAA